jgi:hypothetical protein
LLQSGATQAGNSRILLSLLLLLVLAAAVWLIPEPSKAPAERPERPAAAPPPETRVAAPPPPATATTAVEKKPEPENVEGLAARSDPEATSLLIRIAEGDGDVSRRLDAVKALAERPEALVALEARAKADSDDRVRIAAVRSISLTGGPDAERVLRALAKEAEEPARSHAKRALKRAKKAR